MIKMCNEDKKDLLKLLLIILVISSIWSIIRVRSYTDFNDCFKKYYTHHNVWFGYEWKNTNHKIIVDKDESIIVLLNGYADNQKKVVLK